jgi:hypothetical protein
MTDEQKIRDLERELAQEKQTSIEVKKHLEELEERFDKYVTHQKELENRRLRTALIWAGGVILALGSFIFSEVIWPVIKAGRP